MNAEPPISPSPKEDALGNPRWHYLLWIPQFVAGLNLGYFVEQALPGEDQPPELSLLWAALIVPGFLSYMVRNFSRSPLGLRFALMMANFFLCGVIIGAAAFLGAYMEHLISPGP